VAPLVVGGAACRGDKARGRAMALERRRQLDEAVNGGGFDMGHRGEEGADLVAPGDGRARAQPERRPPAAGGDEALALVHHLVAGHFGDAAIADDGDDATVELLGRAAAVAHATTDALAHVERQGIAQPRVAVKASTCEPTLSRTSWQQPAAAVERTTLRRNVANALRFMATAYCKRWTVTRRADLAKTRRHRPDPDVTRSARTKRVAAPSWSFLEDADVVWACEQLEQVQDSGRCQARIARFTPALTDTSTHVRSLVHMELLGKIAANVGLSSGGWRQVKESVAQPYMIHMLTDSLSADGFEYELASKLADFTFAVQGYDPKMPLWYFVNGTGEGFNVFDVHGKRVREHPRHDTILHKVGVAIIAPDRVGIMCVNG
jgi:hypothetical protein